MTGKGDIPVFGEAPAVSRQGTVEYDKFNIRDKWGRCGTSQHTAWCAWPGTDDLNVAFNIGNSVNGWKGDIPVLWEARHAAVEYDEFNIWGEWTWHGTSQHTTLWYHS